VGYKVRAVSLLPQWHIAGSCMDNCARRICGSFCCSLQVAVWAGLDLRGVTDLLQGIVGQLVSNILKL